jgi:hypothetical protein
MLTLKPDLSILKGNQDLAVEAVLQQKLVHGELHHRVGGAHDGTENGLDYRPPV